MPCIYQILNRIFYKVTHLRKKSTKNQKNQLEPANLFWLLRPFKLEWEPLSSCVVAFDL